jgi:hypothetical protein
LSATYGCESGCESGVQSWIVWIVYENKKTLIFSAFFYLASFVLLTRGRAAPLDGDLSASAVVDEADAPKIAE